jgi:hypothetical protein
VIRERALEMETGGESWKQEYVAEVQTGKNPPEGGWMRGLFPILFTTAIQFMPADGARFIHIVNVDTFFMIIH